jgi:transcriptional regulator with XRE-family HTH domain
MVTGDSPAGARRRVRLAIREARDRRGLTQAQVAEEMEWSLSKVMRIESGEVTVTPNDLRPLLAYLGVTDAAVVDQLVQDSRTSRRRAMWWDNTAYRDHLTPALRQLVQYEAEATEFRYYEQYVVVPGVLQIREYAQAIVESYGMPAETVAARLDARVKRRSEFLDRLGRSQVYLLVDEAAMRRRLVSGEILAAQLKDLLTLAERDTFRLRILHFDADVPPPFFGPFELLELPGLASGNSILYRESQFVDELVEDQTNVARHRKMFEELWSGALDEDASRAMIAEAMSAMGGPPAPSLPPKRRRPTRRGN